MTPLLLLTSFLGADVAVSATTSCVSVSSRHELLASWKKVSAEQLRVFGTVTLANVGESILGEWSVTDRLNFTPRFSFEPGLTYHIKVPGVVDTTFTIPAKKVEPGRVTGVFPQSELLPANALRFTVHFDREMKAGQAEKNIQLLDAAGKAVPFAFLDLGEELWSLDDKRLTLLLHPGRVKKGLVPHRDLGPVLEAGKKYTLVVSKDYQTGDGAGLKEEFRKPITATAAVESGLDPTHWEIVVPKRRGRAAVEIRFKTIMDRALVSQAIAVQDSSGRILEGKTALNDDDTIWRWAPARDWSAGAYTLVVDDELEDCCGNRIGVAFDAALGKIGARQAKPATKLAFEIK